MMRSFSHSIWLFVLLVLLGGCSISPNPITEEELQEVALFDRELIFEAQEPLVGELTLDMAMAMALKYNLENRVRLLEESVANQQLDMTQMDLLPNLATTAGYLDRDNVNASTSVSVLTNEVSLEPSTSQDQEQFHGNGLFTWNLLDFGTSYIQAKQDADRYLIAKKAREKVMLTLLKEVRSAYWQAVAMEQMRSELDEISARVDEQLAYWQSVREQQLRAPVAVLLDIRTLIETRQQLDDVRRSIDTAQAKLANLINAENPRDIQFPVFNDDYPMLPEMSEDLDAMELIALANSADYAAEVYKVRIDQLESRKAITRLFPGIEFTYGANYDDNSFLYNNHWGEFGANLTWDITQLMFVRRIQKFRDTNEQLTLTRKLAINMAVITGVHITWQDYHNSLTRLERAEYLQEIDGEIAELTQNLQRNQKESGAAAIQTELRAFRSKIGSYQSYADAQAAYGELMLALGVNPIPDTYQNYSASELAHIINDNFTSEAFAFTAEGERVLAERVKFDRWVDQLQDEERLLEETVVEEPETYVAENEMMDEPVPQLETPTEDEAGIDEDTLEIAQEQQAPRVEPIVPEQPLQASTEAPDVGQFVREFWLKYFPQPVLDEYLQEFISHFPSGANRQAYLESFLESLPEGPDRDAYLKLFMENLPTAPDKIQYVESFMSKLKSAPSSERYLNDFRSMLEAPSTH